MTPRWRPYLDIQTVQSRGFFERGIPRYTTQLSLELLRTGASVAGFGLNPNHPFPRHLPPELARAPQLTWNTAAALRAVQQDGPILYHVMSPFERPDVRPSALPSHVLGRGVPIVCQVYDLIPDVTGMLQPGTDGERFHRVRNRVLTDADFLIALSEQTRSDVIEHLQVDPDRIAVVGAATSDFFRPPEAGERPRELLAHELPRVTRPFLLTVSAWLPHKNTELLLEAFARLRPDLRRSLQLVVACTLPLEGLIRWEAHAAHVGLTRDEVVFTGFVSVDAVVAKPRDSEEAQRLAERCIRVRVASRVLIVDDSLTMRTIVRISGPGGAATPRGLTGTEYQSGLREKAAAAVHRHTWDRVARRTLAAYERVDAAPARRRRRRSSRLRVALVGPFPPVRSGVARYNRSVADRLTRVCDLDCFVDACDWVHDDIAHELPSRRVQAVGPRRPSASAAGWFPARSLGRTIDPARYDAVVYTIGNSWFHHDTLAVARRYPGIAWFHDVDLVGLYITYAHRLLADDPPAALTLFRELLARYGSRVPGLSVSMDDQRWAAYEPYRRSGLRLTAELAGDSRTSIVSSHRAQTLLERDAGPVPLAPIEVMPLAVPSRRPAEPLRPSTPPVVVTLGREEDAKQRELIVDAIAILNRERPVRLAVVGQIRPDHLDRLVRRIDARGVGDVVDVTGFVTDREYHEWIESATCAVQLNSHANGEGSAAVGDAFAAGLPVITNIESCLELPDGTVAHLPSPTDATAIAREIARVLDDADHRQGLRAGALRYAQSWTVDDVVGRLLEIARDDVDRMAASRHRVSA